MPIDLSMAAGHARYSAHMAQSPMPALVGPKGVPARNADPENPCVLTHADKEDKPR
jgi:hypothetical protein